ncbi:UV DNA damage repair endonuclease UvsE [candidate division WOR-3 bacterium]|nr:UV DNA damage repair endonuclease UvsE [candidate division WOR-3 bacterium]
MKIGYPCLNRTLNCTTGSTFRLKNYSEAELIKKISSNLICLEKTLEFNLENGLFFFRISSDLIPFGSHPVMKFNWQEYFKAELTSIGRFIKKNQMRISMHPDQFTLINAVNKKIVRNSVRELEYHCQILDSLDLDKSAKMQIHIGGVYGDKKASKERFIKNYSRLSLNIKNRLVIENDDKSYSLEDCIEIHDKTGIPVLFDFFHHECLNNGDVPKKALETAGKTWRKKDGIPMVDYSSQKKDSRKGSHAESLDKKHFVKFLTQSSDFDLDLMLEIKDKEKSALKALKLAKEKRRA